MIAMQPEIGIMLRDTFKHKAIRLLSQAGVTGITVSEQQAKYAENLCRGLPVTIRLQDYRDIRGRFDGVLSIGMFEHVGCGNITCFPAPGPSGPGGTSYGRLCFRLKACPEDTRFMAKRICPGRRSPVFVECKGSNQMKKLLIFDPPLCCPTGVCGPSVDPKLSRFAADLDWLKKKGIVVERFNLAQQPGAFAGNETVRAELAAKGNGCLPLLLVDGAIVACGRYPGRKELAGLAGVEFDPARDKPSNPAVGLILPMADAGGCCPAPGAGSDFSAEGEYCVWPRDEKNGRRC